MKIVSAWLMSLFTGMYTSTPELDGMIVIDDNTTITEMVDKPTGYNTFVLAGLGHTTAEKDLSAGGYYHIPSYDNDTIKENIAILPGSCPPIANLSQSVCLWITEKFFARKKPTKNSLAIGYSMGGGRLINALGRNKNNLADNLGMIILDSALISGNHAINKTCQLNFKNLPILKKLVPYLSTSFLPYSFCSYAAKFVFPMYSPGGLQPHNLIENFRDFDKNKKIVFIHSERDPQVDYWGAVYAYFRLKEMEFTNLFFIDDTISSSEHVNSSNLKETTKAFLKALENNDWEEVNKRDTPSEDSEEIIDNLKRYQPNWDHFANKRHYLTDEKYCQYSAEELEQHYKNHTGPFNFVRYDIYLRYFNNYVINPTIAIGACYGAKKLFNYCTKRFFGN